MDKKMELGKIIPYGEEELPEDLVKRFDRLWARQQRLDEKSLFKIWLDGDRIRMPYDCPTVNEILDEIKSNVEEINESRKECMEKDILAEFEADYNRLEKAYYNLKVDIESYMRLSRYVALENT